MLLAGKGCAQVALAVGVARQTVHTWKALLTDGGIDALRAVPERGRPARLDQAQLAQLRAALLQSPTEHGFCAELWTLKRVGALIERLYGVRFGQTQVWRLLGRLGLRPAKARQACLGARRGPRLIVFIDESSLSERPTRVRTWAPKGPTPVIQFHFSWTHLSVIAALSQTNVLLRLHKGSIKKEQAVEFLKALKAHLKQPLLVIWGGLRAHRSHWVRDYADRLGGHIQLAFLPAYSPDLNSVEYLWAWLKRHALANYCPNGSAELKDRPQQAQKRPTSCLDHHIVLGASRALRLS